MEFRDPRKKPILGILSFIIVLAFPLLGILHTEIDISFIEVFELGTTLGWFCIGTGLAFASLLKEKSQGFYIIYPLVAIILSAVLMNFQMGL
jgi:hypothetical protein